MRAALVIVALVSPLTARAPHAQARHLEGIWGGDQVRVAASAGSVEIQIACLRGQADEPATLDADGAFAVSLRLLPLQGMQLQDDDVRTPSTVRGRVRGDTLRLEVGPKDGPGAGAYSLTRGRAARLPDCRKRG